MTLAPDLPSRSVRTPRRWPMPLALVVVAAAVVVTAQGAGHPGASPAPPVRLGDLAPGVFEGSSYPQDLTAAGSRLVFSARDGDTAAVEGDRELWATDGTPAGTVRIADLRAGPDGSSPRNFVTMDGRLWFLANDGVHGGEIWCTEGPGGATWMVKDVAPGPDSGASRGIGALPGGAVCFAGEDAAHVRGLWRSDGTSKGTFRVRDLPSDPFGFVRSGRRVWFLTRDDANRTTVWSTDGTASGTVPVPGAASPEFLTLGSSGVAVLAEYDAVAGRELWRADGTPAGTWRVTDVLPGAESSSPSSFGWAGRNLFFGAWDASAGREPWSIPLTTLGVSLSHLDTDGDGANDAIETAAGTSTADDRDAPVPVSASWTDPAALVTRSRRVTIDFRAPRRDAVTLTGTLPVPARFAPNGANVLVDVGGVARAFKLDRRGRSTPSGAASFTVSLTRRNGVVRANPKAPFTLRITKGTFATTLADEGLTGDVTVKNALRKVPATIVFDGRVRTAELALRYTATRKRTGTAR